jgi:hypothetical protein
MIWPKGMTRFCRGVGFTSDKSAQVVDAAANALAAAAGTAGVVMRNKASDERQVRRAEGRWANVEDAAARAIAGRRPNAPVRYA